MLVSYVIDPDSFAAEHFDENCKWQAITLLEGILENGVLVADEHQLLLKALSDRIDALPQAYRQKIAILFEEILKSRSSGELKRVVLHSLKPVEDLFLLATLLQDELAIDVLITCAEKSAKLTQKCQPAITTFRNLQDLATVGAGQRAYVFLSEYRDSAIEEKRRFWTKAQWLDRLPEQNVIDLLTSCLKFGGNIVFYDPYFANGESPEAAEPFFRGCAHIVQCTTRPGRQRDLHFRFVTRESKKLFAGAGGTGVKAGIHHFDKVVVSGLRHKYPEFNFERCVKFDKKGLWHVRFLKTEHAIVDFEKGFDILSPGGGYTSCFVRLQNCSLDRIHLLEALPDSHLG